MEQPKPQGNAQDMHHPSVGSGSLVSEYWNHIDPLYPASSDQQQSSQQQQPLGITWDHPIFTQQQSNQHQHQHQQHQQTQQTHIQPQPEPNRDIYSATPQSWHQNPVIPQSSISHGSQSYNLSQQHQYQMTHQYPQGQVAFNSRSLSPSSNLTYHPYSLQPHSYYQPSHLSVSESYTQPQPQNIAPHPGPSQQVSMRSSNAQRPLHQYILPAEYPADNNSHTPVNFPNSYLSSGSTASYQQTIDPQFLSSQGTAGPSHVGPQSPFLYYNPADSTYERPNDAKNYQLYRNGIDYATVEQMSSHPLTPHITPGQLAPLQGENAVSGEAVKGTKTAPSRQKKASSSQSGHPKLKKITTKNTSKIDGARSASSDSYSDSSDGSELDITMPEDPSPLLPNRPDNPEGAAEYDALKAVWAPRNRRPNIEKIKSALVAFKDVVKAVRDEWKVQSQAMKDAENKSENDKADELKKKVVLQRRIMNVVVSSALDKGHPLIVEKLGEHPIAVSALYSFLLDRHQASDFDGALTVNILKLLARFTTMDEDVLQKTNVMKLLPRIMKKGGQPIKDLAQKILDNAAASTKRKQEKDESPSKDVTSDSTSDASRTDALAGTKRAREGESNGLPASKRNVLPLAARNGGSATKPGNGNSPADAKFTTSTTVVGSVRPKASIVAPKPTSLFGSLASASKKPGTSNAARAAAAAAAAKEKASAPVEKKEPAPAPPPPKPAFSFVDILADLNKREETAAVKPAEDKPPETEEERQKRLRKEARRKLRVSWKPDDSLTEVRLFTHDPEEEIGPNDGLKRDVGDVKGEGRMLKLHKDLYEEDEEDEMGVKEIELGKYQVPSEIDLDDLSTDDRARNFIKRGGSQTPDSPAKEAQEHREATTLMVFYTSLGDIPSSPKEPPAPSENEMVTDPITFGEPDDRVRAREARYFAAINPKPAQAPQPTAPAAVPSAPLDIANLLKVLQKPAQQQQATPPPQPVQQAPMSDLERTVNMFRQQQQQSQPAPLQIPQVTAPSAPVFNFQKILAVLNTQKQVQQPATFPQIPQSQPALAPNLASIISQLGGSNPQIPQPQSQSQSQSQGQAYEDPERKRMRDGSYNDRFNKRPRMYVDPSAKKHPKAGSVPCRYWREGKCLKGEDCTFRHDPID